VLDDADLRRITEQVQLSGLPDATIATVRDAVARRADAHRYDPPRERLEAYPAWDGTKRVDHLFRYLGAHMPVETDLPDRPRATTPHESFTAYYGGLASRWLGDCVARALDPGCPITCVPILIGDEIPIMAALEALVPLGMLSQLDALPPDLGTMDAARRLAGRWIVVLPPFRRAQRDEHILAKRKAFLTAASDRTGRRGSFGDERLRRCAFVAVRNDHDIADDGGARLFYPVFIEGCPDFEAICADQAQIWAEALATYRQNPARLTNTDVGGGIPAPPRSVIDLLIQATGSDYGERDAGLVRSIEQWLALRPDPLASFTIDEFIHDGKSERVRWDYNAESSDTDAKAKIAFDSEAFDSVIAAKMKIAELLRGLGYVSSRCWRKPHRATTRWMPGPAIVGRMGGIRL
jgi:hypothetical protein